MLVSGRANPELAAKIADKLGVALGGVTLKTFANGEVYCRFEESVRGADVFIVQPTCGNPDDGPERQRRADGAAGDGRRRGRRLGAPRDRRHAVVRLLAPGQEVGPARADQRAAGGADARVGRDRPDPDDGPALRPDPGLLPEALRPHDGAVHAHPVLRRPRPRGPRRRRAGRRPREAEQAVRLEDRRRPGDPQQGAPRPAGRRDQLRDRRRRGQDGGDRRRHHRHRRDAEGRRRRRPRRRRPPRLRRRHARRVLRQRLGEPRRGRLRAGRRDRHDPAAARTRRTTSACSPAPTC